MQQFEFASHDARSLLSVAHLFPRSKGRRGIYVLTFDDGEQYVGQTVNVVGRFAAHRDRWRDIVRLDFARIPIGDLNGPERDMIHASQAAGKTLRNITHAVGVGRRDTPPDLDYSIKEEVQHSWLADGHAEPDAAVRVDDAALRPKGRGKFARLAAHPLGEVAVYIAQVYAQLAILQPRTTELTFWSASAMPATNATHAPRLIAISVNKMETLVLGWDKNDPAAMWGFVNVSKTALTDAYGSVDAYAKPREWVEAFEADYESGGGDVVALHGYSAEEMLTLFVEDDGGGMIHAARALNLSLMRKGPTLQWRWHNFQLADRLLQPLWVFDSE